MKAPTTDDLRQLLPNAYVFNEPNAYIERVYIEFDQPGLDLDQYSVAMCALLRQFPWIVEHSEWRWRGEARVYRLTLLRKVQSDE